MECNEITFGEPEPTTLLFFFDSEEVFRITPDKQVILSRSLYEAGKAFWDYIQSITPKDYLLRVDDGEIK